MARFEPFYFNSPQDVKMESRTSIQLFSSPKLPLISLVMAAFIAIMASSTFSIAVAVSHAHSAIPVRVSQVITTTPRNISDIATSCKFQCNIGFLAPAVFHNSTTVSTPYDRFTSYRKQGVHWYSKIVADAVQAALDDAMRVLVAGSELKKRGGERKQKQGEGQNLCCNVKVEWRDGGWCDEKSALGQAVGLHMAQNIRAFVGPTCHNSLRVVALLASFWTTPVITWEPVQRSVVGDKSYDNVFSVYGAFEDFAQSAAAVIRHLKWKRIAFVYEKSPLCDILMEQLSLEILDRNLATEAHKVVLFNSNTTELGSHLNTIKALTRTIVTCSRESLLLKILSEAEKEGMTNGYYAFLNLDFNVQPLASIDHANEQRSPLDVVLQLGQFHENPKRNEKEEVQDETDEDGGRNGTRVVKEMWVKEDDIPAALSSQHALAFYIHDAIIVATVATQAGLSNYSPKSLGIGPPFQLKTGNIEFDEHGIRKATFSLVQRSRSGEMTTVAEISTNQSATLWREIEWPGGHVPVSDITCSGNDTCIDLPGIIAGVTMGIFALFLLVTLIGYLYRKHRRRQAAAKKDWLVDDRDVRRRRAKLPMSNGFTSGPGSNMETVKRLVRMETRGTLGLGSNCSLDKNMLYAPIGNYKDMVVAVKHVRWTHVQMGKREMLEDLTTVKELSHDNVNQFVGAHVSSEPGSSYVLFRYCSKGSLHDVLANEDIKLDWMFKLSFALDLARGIECIHKTALRSHGNLKSSNCVIDSRWVLKVTDYGAITSYRKPGSEDDQDNKVYYSSLLWTAPELLRMSKRPHKGTQKGDVYSTGIILQEIFFRCAPYFFNYMEPEDIITLVKSDNSHRAYRPVVPPDNELSPRAINLMIACWSEAPDSRPDIHQIRKRVRDLNGAKRFNIMDNMLQMLESYSSNLEQLVTDRTEELEAEKRKTDSLLYQMLPPLVAEQLKGGMSVTPESYDQVSIFFSDIVGFTAIASQSKPLEVVDLLNDLYTCFDEVIARRDVYKVETIGDAYMCVSGCPRRNGNRHAGEIANMALDLISAVSHFRIRHKPEEQLNLRVGLHTGACAAGVVGRTMPRYCLFGDTVNMASRMESTGKALHIHMSSQMKDALDELDWGFLNIERGFIEVKGKGLQKTFWLAGKKNYKKPLPESLFVLQKRLEDGEFPPTPSYTTLTVGDSMFSALRKTSITVSNITVKNSPCTSDTEDMGGDYGLGGVNSTASKYGNLLDASVSQYYGKRKSGENKTVTVTRCGGTDDRVLPSVESDEGDGTPKSRHNGTGIYGAVTNAGGENGGSRSDANYLGGSAKSIDSLGCHDLNLSDAAKRNLSKPRKSLGEIGGSWNTVESNDSDSGVPCLYDLDSPTVCSRNPSASSNNNFPSNKLKGSDRKRNEAQGELEVHGGKKSEHTSQFSAKRLTEKRKEKRNKIKQHGSSESIEVTPTGMKRKRAVVSPPKLVLIESNLNDPARDEKYSDSNRKRLYEHICRDNKSGPSAEEIESDLSRGTKAKCPVKKDSACYSMADSVGDTFEVPNRQCETNMGHHVSTSNIVKYKDDDHSRNIKIVSDTRCHDQLPPILQVTTSSPINSPTGHINADLSSKSTGSVNIHNYSSQACSKDSTASSFTYTNLLSHDFGLLETDSLSSTKTTGLFDQPLSSFDRKFTPMIFDTGGPEVTKVTTTSYSPQELNSSAPIITVQQENGRRSIVSKSWDVEAVSPYFSETATVYGLSTSSNDDNLMNRKFPAERDSPLVGNSKASESIAVVNIKSNDGLSNLTEDSPVKERDHSWFPQSNGKDFLVHNHHSITPPALITVHNEDCPASSANSKQPRATFTTADSSHRQSPEGRSSDVSENPSETQMDLSDSRSGGKDTPNSVCKSNGDVPVRTSRRKHKMRRGKSYGVPEDLPRIDIS